MISNQVKLSTKAYQTELSGGLTPVCQIFKHFVHRIFIVHHSRL